ncbi:MAG: TetR/AcrR family transcriptional regulator [Liquorilactobacillus nagelii]|jgi:AcrR family transcriptional regulator|uniref:TetR/AcrR family transcriptional regulator n=1 Tax=Liquorilactobacillus nagelii TaxID=82688 RepID=UPI002432DEB8|nr:TetR/AcrR family transcriptional regulator [Liquorilactobacillus nagelii]MCI1632724.1 TetR/AcrR family transcriptional regulator [Liquorilactobacillus nagelii]
MVQKRRRGADLEQAIYQAALQLLKNKGFSSLNFTDVADLAKTSKSVIYRRWQTPFSLAVAAIQDKIKTENQGRTDELTLTGHSLREDLLQLLHRFIISMQTFRDFQITELLGKAIQEQDATIQQLISEGNEIDLTALDHVLKRAKKRGEIIKADLPEEIRLLPFDWLRFQLFTNQPLNEHKLELLVDNVLLPIYQSNRRTN